MSERLIELFLFDVFIAIAKIEHTVSNFKNPDELKHHYLSWDSVIGEFEIIGEASRTKTKILEAMIGIRGIFFLLPTLPRNQSIVPI